MNDEEKDEKIGEEEMQGARGLASAEQIYGGGDGGVEGRGEGQASPDDERKQDEDDDDVGGALDDVVGMFLGGVGRGAVEVSREDGPEGAPVAVCRCGEQIPAEVVIQKARSGIDEAGDYQNPGRLEVEIAAPAILVGHDVVVARGNGVAGCGDGDLEEWGGAGVAGFAPSRNAGAK